MRDWESWVILEDVEMVHDNCGHYMRVFSLSNLNRGKIKGKNLKTNALVEDEIISVNASVMITEENGEIEEDYHMIFSSKNAKYVMASPKTLYAPYFLEMQGIMVIIFMIKVQLRLYPDKQRREKLEQTFATCSELLIMSFSEYELEDFLAIFEYILSENEYNTYRCYLILFLGSINNRMTILPAVSNCHFDHCAKTKIPIGKYTEIKPYPLMYVTKDKQLFVPFDIADPINGEYSSFINVQESNEEEIEMLIQKLASQFVNEPLSARPPYLARDVKFTTKKKTRLEILLPKNSE